MKPTKEKKTLRNDRHDRVGTVNHWELYKELCST